MSEINNDPVVMEISAFSMIHHKLKFLASVIKDESGAGDTLVHISCHKKIDNTGKEASIIRFSTDHMIICETNPLYKYGGAILDKAVSVNVYDLFNMVNQCMDELISFWVDDEDPDNIELVVSSYHNDEADFDELEFRIAAKLYTDVIEITTDEVPVYKLQLSNVLTYTATKELNIENKCDAIQLCFTDGKLELYSEYNGVIAKLKMKETDNINYGENLIDIKIPFNIFNLMVSTGDVTKPIELHVYANNYFTLTTTDYAFHCKYEPVTVNKALFNDVGNTIFIIDPVQGLGSIDRINKINVRSPSSVITYDKVSDGIGDFVTVYPGKYSVNVRAFMATISDKSISFDGDLFADLFTNTGVDAIQINEISEGILYIGYENQYMYKALYYNHAEFQSYREKIIKQS